MTAYVHIGAEKTGTTTIQSFLFQNADLLTKQKYAYLKFFGANSQWGFTFLGYKELRKDEFCISHQIYDDENFKKQQNNIFNRIKDELHILKNVENVVFSS